METQNLQAASTYVNNLLLARGLLKSGQAIDFADPESNEGGIDATMARVINLVNDLVLRRDGKLKTKNSELSRSLALAEASERALKANITGAETTIRGLKEKVQRMKSTVQQVRAQCANDIRKRDLEMQRLKSHLAERQRGKREGLGVTTININPATKGASHSKSSGGGRIEDPGYSLTQETTEFLTELCQNLSNENDALIELARNTVNTLKELQGLSESEGKDQDGETMGMAASANYSNPDPTVVSLPTSYEELSARMDDVLEHLRTLLTNPSFVPLEEVEMRDQEIGRLREGWEKMESRWKQAVSMMDGWQRRMTDGGDTVGVEERKRGMTLDLSFMATEESTAQQSRLESSNISPILEDQQEEDVEQGISEAKTKTQEQVREAPDSSKSRSKVRRVPGRSDRALRERSDNAVARPRRLRKVSFTPGLHGSPAEPPNNDEETLLIKAHKAETVTRRPSRRKTESSLSRQAKASDLELSVSQKLAAVEDEARLAEQSRKERETRKRSRPEKAASRAGTRRRSTLTSDELEDLMGVPSR
ncbi:hypothetical protein N7539_006957 [Penicillium diatomitis]|uniref:NIMA interactive protein n=1 Tax=Penicillium diatomitis TaxID=2819901 RepID=A0A9W9X2A4_9EURO|nr:uncharacterized protein N7539_006957 [Penicillium diatomitis]KAJ5481063.1 hypothetical protein N7539_006957 [Penicillium diatomitis]